MSLRSSSQQPPAGPPKGEGGRRGHCPGTRGGPRFRIGRFRMQNLSAQTTACGRGDVFFDFGLKFVQLRTAMTLFGSSLDVEP